LAIRPASTTKNYFFLSAFATIVAEAAPVLRLVSVPVTSLGSGFAAACLFADPCVLAALRALGFANRPKALKAGLQGAGAVGKGSGTAIAEKRRGGAEIVAIDRTGKALVRSVCAQAHITSAASREFKIR